MVPKTARDHQISQRYLLGDVSANGPHALLRTNHGSQVTTEKPHRWPSGGAQAIPEPAKAMISTSRVEVGRVFPQQLLGIPPKLIKGSLGI